MFCRFCAGLRGTKCSFGRDPDTNQGDCPATKLPVPEESFELCMTCSFKGVCEYVPAVWINDNTNEQVIRCRHFFLGRNLCEYCRYSTVSDELKEAGFACEKKLVHVCKTNNATNLCAFFSRRPEIRRNRILLTDSKFHTLVSEGIGQIVSVTEPEKSVEEFEEQGLDFSSELLNQIQSNIRIRSELKSLIWEVLRELTRR